MGHRTITLIIIGFLLLAGGTAVYITKPYWGEIGESIAERKALADDDCSALVIPINGAISVYSGQWQSEGQEVEEPEATSDNILDALDTAEHESSIKAAILWIDSPGGLPAAAEEIANAVKRLSKPVVAVIRQSGTSGGYWVASAADQVFALNTSDIGSIGVTSSYLSNVERNKREGYNYVDLSSGKFKDLGSSDKPLTAQDRALLMRDINITHDIFVRNVAENRNLPIEKVRALADGSTMMGQQALDSGLIDEIGDLDTAKNYLNTELDEELEYCFY